MAKKEVQKSLWDVEVTKIGSFYKAVFRVGVQHFTLAEGTGSEGKSQCHFIKKMFLGALGKRDDYLWGSNSMSTEAALKKLARSKEDGSLNLEHMVRMAEIMGAELHIQLTPKKPPAATKTLWLRDRVTGLAPYKGKAPFDNNKRPVQLGDEVSQQDPNVWWPIIGFHVREGYVFAETKTHGNFNLHFSETRPPQPKPKKFSTKGKKEAQAVKAAVEELKAVRDKAIKEFPKGGGLLGVTARGIVADHAVSEHLKKTKLPANCKPRRGGILRSAKRKAKK